MATAMQATRRTSITATPAIWTGRVISGLMALFMAFDSIIKVLQLPVAIEASAEFGLSAGAVFAVGALALACLVLYLIPRTAPLGAVLLTGYLGGASATHVGNGSPVFSVIFPIIIGALLWVGLALRDPRARALLAGR